MMMTKGLTRKLGILLLLLPLTAIAAGEIYRVVDENGNVTFTDQKPASGGEVVDLPPLSVIETDIQVPDQASADAEAAEAESAPPTRRELRRQFRDFRITQPENEETFWGTGNTVVVSWGSSQVIPPEMSAVLYVNGEAQDVPATGSVTLTLDRGEHQVYAELLDQRKRRLVTTPTVTFFVKQHSVLFNQPNVSPSG
jgi:hypothetical protein